MAKRDSAEHTFRTDESHSLRLHFTTDGAAFGGDGTERRAEVARILHEIADKITAGAPYEYFQTIYDGNGNDVGRYALKPASYK